MAKAKAKDPVWKILDQLPKGVAAVIFFPDGTMQVMLPKREPEELIELDSPIARATISGAIHLDEHEDLRVQMYQRIDGLTQVPEGGVH